MNRKLVASIVGLALVVGGAALVVFAPDARAGVSRRGRVAARVGGVPIFEDDVVSGARDLSAPVRFGSEEVAPALANDARPLSEAQLAQAREKLVDEEALVQEALRRGYDRSDPHVGRRLVQRVLEEASACHDDETLCLCGEGVPAHDELFEPCAARARRAVGVTVEPDALARVVAAAHVAKD